MLLSMLRNSQYGIAEMVMQILMAVFAVLLSLSVHELSHGFAAYLMGDNTAKYSGRLTLNPLSHLDPIGAIFLLLFGFGWAKPVPIDPRNFRNSKVGTVITSLAGPLSNILLGFVAMILVYIVGKQTSPVLLVIKNLCVYLLYTNVGLAIFNFIPIPPLDGSKILNSLLPARIYFKIMQYERYGMIILLVLINLPFFNRFLSICTNAVIMFYSMIINLFI